MNKIFVFFAFIIMMFVLVSAVQSQDVYVLKLKYDKGEVSALNLLKTDAYFHESVDIPENGYLLEVISLDDKVIYSQKFDFDFEIHVAPDRDWFDENGTQIYFPNVSETTQILDSSEIELMFPYYEEAREIRVSDSQGNKLISLNVNGELDIKDNLERDERLNLGLVSWIVIVLVVLAILIWWFLRSRRN